MELIEKLEFVFCGPLFIMLLVGVGVYYTVTLKFPQIRYFIKSFRIILGVKEDKEKVGDTSPFKALSTSLGGSIGVGCIAGTGIALNIGGPRSIFWMLIATFFSMATKFVEVYLCHKYREQANDGTMVGSPMFYIQKKLKMKWLGVFMGIATVIYASAFANMPQANTITKSITHTFGYNEILIGLLFSIAIGFIIFGGITRISKISGNLIPFMTILYLLVCIVIIFKYRKNIPHSLSLIFSNLFSPTPIIGGFIGSAVFSCFSQGINRSYYTNDSGSGASGIAHASSTETNSLREAKSSIIEPFLCTGIMCTITALVIISSGTWNEKYFIETDISDIRVYSEEVLETFAEKKKLRYNGAIEVINGNIQNKKLVLVHLNSILEDIEIRKNDKLYTGIIKTYNGKIDFSSGQSLWKLPFFSKANKKKASPNRRVYRLKEYKIYGRSIVTGILPTYKAFTSVLGRFGAYILSICVVLFAFTTILTWFYYGDRALVYLGAGKALLLIYKVVFMIMFFAGSFFSSTWVWRLNLISYALMGVPSLISLILMRKEVPQ